MEGIYIINDGLNPIIKELDYNKIDFAERKSAADFDEFVVALFSTYNVEKLIIPIRLGKYSTTIFNGLTLGLHIRLTNNLKENRLIPLIFFGEEDLEEIFLLTQNNLENPAYILTTTGSIYTNDISKVQTLVKEEKGVTNLEMDVLNHLKILNNSEESGNHSIANIWGALRLDEVLSLKAFPLNTDLIRKSKELYFKFHTSLNTPEVKAYVDLKPLNCTGKRILLIDDEEEKGWDSIMRIIFKNADFQSIKFIGRSFEEAYAEAVHKSTKEDWDLILLDLRLNPIKEDLPNQILLTKDYSGSKLLQIIKNNNEGAQIIMLTASNKAWNMKNLLDLKADGYYIKESPEYNFQSKFTKENFDNFKFQIESSFNLSYLKNIIQTTNKCKTFICLDSPKRSHWYQLFYDRTLSAFEIAFELLKRSSLDQKYRKLAYLTYFQIIEDYVSQKENFEIVFKGECYVDNRRTRVVDNSAGTLVWKLKFNKSTNGDFFSVEDEIKTDDPNIQTLAKVSFVLAYKFNQTNPQLIKWAKINDVRNKKVGHSGRGIPVSVSEIIELLDVIELLLTKP